MKKYTQSDPVYIHGHRSIIHNSKKVETAQVFISESMDKPNVVDTYNGILFYLKKKEDFGTWGNMDKPSGQYAR